VKTYGQYCPIVRGAEIFANRWTPVIVRNLLLGCETFGEIRAGAPGISRTLLSQRLRDLERAGIVERRPGANGRGAIYALTEAGAELQGVCDALGTWGARWLEAAPEHLDAGVVLWSLCRQIDVGALPDSRLVVRFDLSDGLAAASGSSRSGRRRRCASATRASTTTSSCGRAPSASPRGTPARCHSAARCAPAR